MDSNRSRAATLIGVAAAAGAFGVAVMMSAATAPTARADDFSEIIGAVETDFTNGQGDFSTIFTELSSNGLTADVGLLIDGIDDDSLSAPQTLLVGTVEALTHETVDPPSDAFYFALPTSFTEGVDSAEGDLSYVPGFFSEAATALSSGDYGDAVYLDFYGLDYSTLIPLQELLLGALASF
jgi:hypothetical protein